MTVFITYKQNGAGIFEEQHPLKQKIKKKMITQVGRSRLKLNNNINCINIASKRKTAYLLRALQTVH